MGAPADVALPIRCRFAAAGDGLPGWLRVAGGTLTPPRPGTWQVPMARRLSLLGGFELRSAGTEVAVARGGQRLLALLALQGRPLERLWVAGTLWLDATEERAGASLRSALWRLPQPGGTAVVEASPTHLRLARDLAVDVQELAGLAQELELPAAPAGREGGDLDPARLTMDLLPDWYEDWVVLERERLRQLRLHALEALCARLTGAGRFGAAVQAGLAAVAGEPLRESAHRTLIRAHLAEGNPGEAVRQYHLYRRLLADELAIEPSPAIRGLVAPLLPASATRPPPGRGLGRGRRLPRRRGLAAAAPRSPGAVMPR
jgi:DNA-binding SARP family transcriptional activator